MNMVIQLINKELLSELHNKAAVNERLRVNFDLRNSTEDNSQRMLNVLQPGTIVEIHRHEETSESVICLQGRMEVIFYADVPNIDSGGPGRGFQETFRTELCPLKGEYGVQVPKGVWHTVAVYEESTIFEAKDGMYIP